MELARVSRCREAMRGLGLDALFVSNPKNVQYLTGIRAMMEGLVMPFHDPEYFVLLQAERCDVLCDGRYINEVRGRGDVGAALLEAPVTPKGIAERIRSLLGAGARVLGYERDAVLYGDGVALMAALEGLEFRPAEALLAGLRVRKTRDEVEKLRRAQAITGQAFEHIAGWIRPGMTERQVALEIDNYLRTHSEGNSFHPIVAFGETGCNPHYAPSPTRRLEKAQMVLLDFGGIHEGYCGDLTRMLVMGRADARQREVYDLVLGAQRRCLEMVRPGLTCEELDAACRNFFRERGCAEAFLHGTGHGVGLAIHEDPRIKSTFKTKVEPGMVFTVEPGLYYAGWGGVRIEDMVVVTESGCENLTTTSKELVEVKC
jgi:Xaa-Pro aminopeptidase